MKLIDTHCHLCHGRLRPHVDDVLNRPRAVGVVGMICAAGDLPESVAALFGLTSDRSVVGRTLAAIKEGREPSGFKRSPLAKGFLFEYRRTALPAAETVLGC